MGQPELKHERAPQRGTMVAPAHQMLPGEATYGGPVQEVIEPAVRHHKLIDPMTQGRAEPPSEGHRKAVLRALQDLGRDNRADRVSEHLLARAVADLECRRQRERKLD